MPIGPGSNVLLEKPGDSRKHLWVVLAGPDPENRVIIANLTSQRPGADNTVVIDPGEHPFVSKPTVVFYADARIGDGGALEAAMLRYPTYQDFEGELLKRIQRGLFASDNTPDDVKDLARQLLPDLTDSA